MTDSSQPAVQKNRIVGELRRGVTTSETRKGMAAFGMVVGVALTGCGAVMDKGIGKWVLIALGVLLTLGGLFVFLYYRSNSKDYKAALGRVAAQ